MSDADSDRDHPRRSPPPPRPGARGYTHRGGAAVDYEDLRRCAAHQPRRERDDFFVVVTHPETTTNPHVQFCIHDFTSAFDDAKTAPFNPSFCHFNSGSESPPRKVLKERCVYTSLFATTKSHSMIQI